MSVVKATQADLYNDQYLDSSLVGAIQIEWNDTMMRTHRLEKVDSDASVLKAQQSLFKMFQDWKIEPIHILRFLSDKSIRLSLIMPAVNAGLLGENWLEYLSFIIRQKIQRILRE